MDTVLKLRELRARVGLTQNEVARRSGVGAKTLSSFESGARIDTMKLAQLEAILNVYGVTPADFFSAALDRKLAPWAYVGAPEYNSLVHELEALPNAAKQVVVEKLRLAIELAHHFGAVAESQTPAGHRPLHTS